MSYQQSRTTRTYHYSGGPGSGGARVTETRIIGGPGGTKTETKTYYGGQVPDSIGFSGFGAPLSDGFGSNTGGGFTTRFGDMNINGGTPAKFPVSTRRSQPAESRYVKGWGSRKSYDKPAPGLPPMQLEGKTYAEIKAQCLREGRCCIIGSTNPCRITRKVEQTKYVLCTLKNIYSSRCSHIAVHG